MTWDIVFVQIALLANLMLRTVGVNLQDLFSSKHCNVFCKSSEDYSPLQYAVYRMLTHSLQIPAKPGRGGSGFEVIMKHFFWM